MPEIRRPFAMNLAALPDGKVTVEDRTDKATPEPGLSKKEWEQLRHVSATFYVGADRGERPVNRAGACAADGDKYPIDVVDKRFRAMRTLLLKEKKASAADFESSRTIMEGWYGGKPKGEHSAAYQIIYKGPKYAPRGEKTEKQFKEAMRHLASGVSALLCQDEVLVVFDVPEGKFTESYSGGPKDRQRAEVLRTAKGFEGVGLSMRDLRFFRHLRQHPDFNPSTRRLDGKPAKALLSQQKAAADDLRERGLIGTDLHGIFITPDGNEALFQEDDAPFIEGVRAKTFRTSEMPKGSTATLAEMLKSNSEYGELVAWLRTAKVGDEWHDVVDVTRVT